MSQSRLSDCRMIELPKITDTRGNLTFIEELRQCPFEFKRVYYLYDVPKDEDRGGHAHRDLEQFIIAVNGSFDIELDDGFEKKSYQMNSSVKGLYIPKMIWRSLDHFADGTFCLVLASQYYDSEDYIRDYGNFQNQKKAKNVFIK